jgi:ATP-binding cassette, subfamily B, multidrug efflux pump
MLATTWSADKALAVARRCHFWQWRSWLLLSAYYLMTLFNAVLDGLSMVALVQLFVQPSITSNPLQALLQEGLQTLGVEVSLINLLWLTVALFVIRVGLYFLLLWLQDMMRVWIRRDLQNGLFTGLMKAQWAHLRQLQTGRNVVTLTEEVMTTSRYFLAVLRSGYFLLTSCVLVLMALWINASLTLFLGSVLLPVVLAMRGLFVWQARLSLKMTRIRQRLAADMTEHLHNLFQIKTEVSPLPHIRRGLRHQPEFVRLESKVAWLQALIAAAILLLPAISLLAFMAWVKWQAVPAEQLMAVLASIGVLGARISVQVNGLMASVGTLTRFSGSLLAVYDLLNIPPVVVRRPIEKPVDGVRVEYASYQYDGQGGVVNINLQASKGIPLWVNGASGSGKSTLANLLAGLLLPQSGRVMYLSGASFYDARNYQAKVGYVTQDVFLYQGSVRDNLDMSGDYTDAVLWQALEDSEASIFVKKLGGLDSQLLESGRSLSGGQKRRLGIARVLLACPDILILDEITAGLDVVSRLAIEGLVAQLASNKVVVLISHDTVRIAVQELILS